MTLVGGPFDGHVLKAYSGKHDRIWFDGPPATAWYSLGTIYLASYEEPRPCYQKVDDESYKFIGWCKSDE